MKEKALFQISDISSVMIIGVCILQNMHVEHETVQWFIFSFLYDEYISTHVLKLWLFENAIGLLYNVDKVEN